MITEKKEAADIEIVYTDVDKYIYLFSDNDITEPKDNMIGFSIDRSFIEFEDHYSCDRNEYLY